MTSWKLSVRDSEFIVGGGTPGQPGYSQARGRPGDDGSLVLSGSGIASSKRNSGKSFPVFFQGRLDGERFVLKGSLGDRSCTVVLARG